MTKTGLASALNIVRLSLHVLGATIWVGGQLSVAGLLPTLRSFGREAPRRVAGAFARLAWPAFVLLVATGIWNVTANDLSSKTHAWNVVLGVKIAVVVLSALAAGLHQLAQSRKVIGATGGAAALTALAALVLGIALAG